MGVIEVLPGSPPTPESIAEAVVGRIIRLRPNVSSVAYPRSDVAHSDEEAARARPPAAGDASLADLLLPEKSRAALDAPLRGLGLTLHTAAYPDPGARERVFNVAQGERAAVHFIHVPPVVLDDPRFISEVGALYFCFEPRTVVRFISEECGRVSLAYRNAWQLWTKRNVDTDYLDWPSIEDLAAYPERQRPQLLLTVLRLPAGHIPGVAAGNGSRSAADFADDDDAMKSIITLMAELASNSGMNSEIYFRDLVRSASLPEEWRREIDRLPSRVDTAAREVVRHFLSKGTNPKDTRYSAIASVLVELLDSLGSEGRATVMSVIERFHLISDAGEIARLRHEHGVGE